MIFTHRWLEIPLRAPLRFSEKPTLYNMAKIELLSLETISVQFIDELQSVTSTTECSRVTIQQNNNEHWIEIVLNQSSEVSDTLLNGLHTG